MKALDALTNGLFDYAGMFPPAALSFPDALAESATFQQALSRPSIVGADMPVQQSTPTRAAPPPASNRTTTTTERGRNGG